MYIYIHGLLWRIPQTFCKLLFHYLIRHHIKSEWVYSDKNGTCWNLTASDPCGFKIITVKLKDHSKQQMVLPKEYQQCSSNQTNMNTCLRILTSSPIVTWSGTRNLVLSRRGRCLSPGYRSIITGTLLGCCSRICSTSRCLWAGGESKQLKD